MISIQKSLTRLRHCTKNKRKRESRTNEAENGFPVHFCPFHTLLPTLNLKKPKNTHHEKTTETERHSGLWVLCRLLLNPCDKTLALPSFVKKTKALNSLGGWYYWSRSTNFLQNQKEWRAISQLKTKEVTPTSLRGRVNHPEERCFTLTRAQSRLR